MRGIIPGLPPRARSGRRGVEQRRFPNDNETGKGDHRHIRGRETPYEFKSVEQLRSDFERDVKATGGKHEKNP